MTMDNEQRFEFIVEQLKDGTYLARSFGACIVTEADTMEDLKKQAYEAVCCHFDEGCSPGSVVLRLVKVIKEEIVEG